MLETLQVSQFVAPPRAQFHSFYHVLRVETGKEFEAKKHLEYRGLEPFLPTYRHTKYFSDRRPVTTDRALFPSYMMVALSPCDVTLAITSPHVYDLLRFGMHEATIDSDEMDRIRVLGEMDGVEPWQLLTAGARVRLVDGPLRGAVGRILERKGQLQMAVEIEMFKQAARVTVDGWTLEAA
jgi:transcription antitermination factor NusG